MRIKYLDQINNFWALTEEEESLSPIDISVYFALLKYNNSLNWINPFSCDWSTITQYSRVSKNSYYASLKKLQTLQLISYQQGTRNVLKAKISILVLKNRTGTIKEQHEEQKVEQHEEQKGNLYRILDLKTIRLIESNYLKINNYLHEWIEKSNLPPTETNPLPLESEKGNTLTPEGAGEPIVDKSKKKEAIPQFWEVLEYAIEKEPNISEQSLKLKYQSWIENDWKTGFDKPIKRWRSTVLNTIPHLKKNPITQSEIGKIGLTAIELQKSLAMTPDNKINNNNHELHD